MNIDLSQYKSQAVLFGDGANGGYLHIYSITKNNKPTGVIVEISAETRKGPVTRRFEYNGWPRPTLKIALASYETDQANVVQ